MFRATEGPRQPEWIEPGNVVAHNSERARLVENRHRAVRERHLVLTHHLHPHRRNRPCTTVPIDLVPCHKPHFARASRSQNQELERKSRRLRTGASSKTREKRANLRVRHRLMVLLRTIAIRKNARDVRRRIVGAMPFGNRPPANGADALQHSHRRGVLVRPQRCEHREHVTGSNRVNAALPELRKDIEAHRLAPCLLGACAPPRRALQRQDGFERFLERRRRGAGSSARVAPITRDTTILDRPFPRICQAHQWIGAETEVPAPAVDHEPLYPGLRDPLLALGPDDAEDQTMLVVVFAGGAGGTHECGGELLGRVSVPVSVPLRERE